MRRIQTLLLNGAACVLRCYCIAFLLFPWQLAEAQPRAAFAEQNRGRMARDGLEGFGSFAESPEVKEAVAEIEEALEDREGANDSEEAALDPLASASSSSSSVATNNSANGNSEFFGADFNDAFGSSSSSSSTSISANSSSSSSGAPSQPPQSIPSNTTSSSSSSSSSGSSSQDSGGSSGSNDLNFLNGLLGGLVGSLLGSLGGGGGLFGGGGGGGGSGGTFPNGDVQGTNHGLYGNLEDYSKLFPGDPERDAEGEDCEVGPHANGAPGDLSDNDTQVLTWQGSNREFNANVGQGVADALGSNAEVLTFGPGGQGGSSDMYRALEQAAGDTSGKKYVVVFNCHGSPGSPGNWEGGLNTRSVERSLKQGLGEGKSLDHITFVDGACFPCRGPYLASQQQSEGITPINHVRSGRNQNRVQYYNPRTGNSHTVTGFVGAVNKYLNSQRGNRALRGQSETAQTRRGKGIVLTREILIGVGEIWAEESRLIREQGNYQEQVLQELRKRRSPSMRGRLR